MFVNVYRITIIIVISNMTKYIVRYGSTWVMLESHEGDVLIKIDIDLGGERVMRPVRRETLAVMVAEEIRRDILDGNFKVGEKLPPENELAQQLGVGRPTVREALRILEGEGLILFKFGEGAYVMGNVKNSYKVSSYFLKEKMLELLEYELKQAKEEGKEVSAMLQEEFHKLKRASSLEEIEEYYCKLSVLSQRRDFSYREPTSWEEIQNERSICWEPSEARVEALREKIKGAWLGRCVGCLLGKPVEGWSKEEIEEYLKTTDSYPLKYYFIYAPEKIAEGRSSFHPSAVEATRGNIECMSRDDDIDYTILNLKVVQESGLDFSSEDVGEAWLSCLPYNMVYTAEKQAYANLVRGLKPPFTATYWNPFREWIGAQIRADIFGYLTPGRPELAAHLAYKDASLSHTKNGMYGEIFVAAAIAAAAVTDKPEEIVKAGLSQIPKLSRTGELVKRVLSWREERINWQEAWKRVEDFYGDYHWVHVLPNLAYVLIALLWGEGDFRKTVSIAVMCGKDTDCNGATAGSILGMMLGEKGIPMDMTEPLNNKVKSAVFGFCETRISELAELTIDLVEKLGGF